MRTTLNTIYSRINTNLGKITTDMGKINDQISSGMQMSKLSEEPVNLVSALRFRSAIVELDQYSENIQSGNTIITAAESALTQMKDLSLRAKTLAIQATDPGYTAANREAIAEEIKNMFEQAVSLANTQINGKYIFGGFRTEGYTEAEPAPFMIDKGDGYWINGEANGALSATPPATLPVSSGYEITASTLMINGIAVSASTYTPHGGYDTYTDASTEAKAKAINDIEGETGVSAVVVPAEMAATAEVKNGTLVAGDLKINGVDIRTTSDITVADLDLDNTLVTAINLMTNDPLTPTGVKATRDENGTLQLTAIDGRNIHVETSANGEAITQLTGFTDLAGDPASGKQVTFGSLQLRSDRKFIIETTAGTDAALAPLGLDGNKAQTDEPDDTAGDGRIDVFSIHNREGSVRYAGDRVNDLSIKIGKTNTMEVGKNGKDGIMDTSIFTTLKAMEDYLRGENFTTVTGIHSASDRSVLLDSRSTGLEPDSLLPDEELFTLGKFTVTVTDHDYNPPRPRAMTIAIDPTVDTLDSVSARINGIANLSATWTADGQLKIASDNPERYTVAFSADSTNFLKASGVSSEFMQSEGIFTSIADLDTLMEKLTQQVSDFGSRANRIDIQSQIYSTMIIATKENLSEVQDTDMIKAIMDLKAKETAYQAALSAASKTMQLSLVDYLR